MNETPTPPEGYRLLTGEEKTKPLPMDTLVLWGEHWEPSTLRGHKITLSSDFGNLYATAQPLPCFQSPDQGQWTEGKHAFPPERVAPEPTAEQRIAELERKLADIEGPEPYSEEILERRDLVMRINVRDRRIAELERENERLNELHLSRTRLTTETILQCEQLRAANAQLERERDEVIRNATLWADQSTLNATRWQDAEARLKEANEGWLKTAADATAEWDQRLNALSSLLIFHGHRIEEARSEGFPLAAEGNCKCRICSAYYAENAALRAQLAQAQADAAALREWVQESVVVSMKFADGRVITKADLLATKHFLPTTTENTKPQ